MKVLHVYKDYFPVLGGIENHIRFLAEGQVRLGLDVTVLVTNPGARTTIENMNGVRVIRAGRLATIASTPVSPGLFAWMRRIEADITHLHFPYPVGEAANYFFGRSKHTVITYHSDIVRQQGLLKLYRPLLLKVLGKADRIIATSAQYVQSSPYLGRFAGKTVVVPLGIPLEQFAPPSAERIAAFRKKLALSTTSGNDAGGNGEVPADSRFRGRKQDGNVPVLLFVGRLRYYKGLDTLIEAMPQVRGVLLVVGTGPMESEWRSLAKRTGVHDRVFFVGDVRDEDLPVFYSMADVYVSSARHRSEAYGVSIIEAMACGKPVISTELGTGTSFVNLDGITGLVVPPGDPQALAAAINHLLADDSLRNRLGENGRKRAQQEFSAELMVERILKLYNELSPRN